MCPFILCFASILISGDLRVGGETKVFTQGRLKALQQSSSYAGTSGMRGIQKFIVLLKQTANSWLCPPVGIEMDDVVVEYRAKSRSYINHGER